MNYPYADFNQIFDQDTAVMEAAPKSWMDDSTVRHDNSITQDENDALTALAKADRREVPLLRRAGLAMERIVQGKSPSAYTMSKAKKGKLRVRRMPREFREWKAMLVRQRFAMVINRKYLQGQLHDGARKVKK